MRTRGGVVPPCGYSDGARISHTLRQDRDPLGNGSERLTATRLMTNSETSRKRKPAPRRPYWSTFHTSPPSVVPPILWPGSPSLALGDALHMNQRPVWHRPLSRLNQKNPEENTSALTPRRLGKPLAFVVERNWCQNPWSHAQGKQQTTGFARMPCCP